MTTEASRFFETFKKDMIGDINTCAIGEIISFDPVSLMANVHLLPNGEYLTAVPVSMPKSGDFIIRIPYKKGDKVVVVFSHGDIECTIYQDNNNISKRTHSINDAIVIGGINLASNPLPGSNPDDLVIAKNDFSTKLTLGNDGKMEMSDNQGAAITLLNGSISITGPNGVNITGQSSNGSW